MLRVTPSVFFALLLACGDSGSPSTSTDERAGDAAGSSGDGEGGSPAEDELAAPVDVAFSFEDQAARRGLGEVNHCGDPTDKRYLLESIGSGAAFLDYDADGRIDLYVVDGCTLNSEADGSWEPAMDGRSRLYRNKGEGRFEDRTVETGAGYAGMGCGALAGDIDGDGASDLFLTAWGPNVLFHNQEDGDAASRRFVDVAAEAGVADPRWSTGACWLDADHDGDLDLYVANYFSMDADRDPDCWKKVDCPWHDMLAACGPKGMVADPDLFYRNRGDGSFEEVGEAVGMREVEPRYGLGVVALDHDLDGDTDVYVANDSRGNFLFENGGAGMFEDVADFFGASLNRRGVPQAGMGIACGDHDGDGDDDLFLTNFSHDYNTLYRNDRVEFMDVTRRSGFGQDVYFALGWGAEFADFDNDGARELFVANGHIYPAADQRAELAYRQPNRLYVYRSGVMFDVSELSGPGLAKEASSRGVAVGDVDEDGDLDLLVVELNEAPSLLINALPAGAGHWLKVSLEGVEANRDGIGARVEVTAGGRTQAAERRSGQSFVSSHDPRLHFGLGGSELVEKLVVHWPGGAPQTFEQLAADRWIHVVQGAAEVTERAP